MNKKYCYIHIPFCESKCKYCRFASIWNLQKLQIQKYVKHLCSEIGLSNTDNSNLLYSLYFWWWTPSTLSNNQFVEIFASIKNKYIFSKNIEICLESTPQNITNNNLSCWKELWINRISIWIQSLNDKTLKEIWRKDKTEIFNAFNILESFFVDNNDETIISIDFIIWLPYAEKWWVLKDIKLILNKYSFVKHISVYMLEDYYEETEEPTSKYEKITYPVDWWKLWIVEDDYLSEYLEIKAYLESNNIFSYEISNFSEKGKECKHNQAYWNHSDVVAYWLWANGYEDNTRYNNSDSFKDYYHWENIEKELLSKKDIFLEKVMFELRTSWLTKKVYLQLNQEKIAHLIKNKLLEKYSWKIRVTNNWISLLDYIASEIV